MSKPTMLNPAYRHFTSLVELENEIVPEFFTKAPASWIGEGINSLEAALKKSRSAWIEGLEEAENVYDQMKELVNVSVEDTMRRVEFSEEDGDEVDMDRLRSGQAFFRKSVRQSKESSGSFTIVVDTTSHSGQNSQDLIWRGMVSVICSEILEEAGHRVRIICIDKLNLHKAGCNVVSVTLKDFSDPIDRSTLINCLSGWYDRAVRIAHWQTIDGQESGLPLATITKPDLDKVSQEDHANRMFITHVFNRQDAVRFCIEELERVTTTLQP